MKADAAGKIDAVLEAWAADTDQAFAVCIARHGVIVLHKAYGKHDGKSVTVETNCWLMSLPKLMSAMAMMILVDQSVVGIDERLDNYLPPPTGDGGWQGPTVRPLTFRHLFTHPRGMSWHHRGHDDEGPWG